MAILSNVVQLVTLFWCVSLAIVAYQSIRKRLHMKYDRPNWHEIADIVKEMARLQEEIDKVDKSIVSISVYQKSDMVSNWELSYPSPGTGKSGKIPLVLDGYNQTTDDVLHLLEQERNSAQKELWAHIGKLAWLYAKRERLTMVEDEPDETETDPEDEEAVETEERAPQFRWDTVRDTIQAIKNRMAGRFDEEYEGEEDEET